MTAGIEWTGKKSYWLEEGKKVEDGRAEGLWAIGDGGQAAIWLTSETDDTGSGSLLDLIYLPSWKKWFSDSSSPFAALKVHNLKVNM